MSSSNTGRDDVYGMINKLHKHMQLNGIRKLTNFSIVQMALKELQRYHEIVGNQAETPEPFFPALPPARCDSMTPLIATDRSPSPNDILVLSSTSQSIAKRSSRKKNCVYAAPTIAALSESSHSKRKKLERNALIVEQELLSYENDQRMYLTTQSFIEQLLNFCTQHQRSNCNGKLTLFPYERNDATAGHFTMMCKICEFEKSYWTSPLMANGRDYQMIDYATPCFPVVLLECGT